MVAPAVAAAGIGALGSIVGGIFGGKGQKKAAKKAAAAQQAAVQAQLQLGQQSLALNRDIYNANFGLLSPYVSRGNVAGDQLNALLGLGAAPAIASPLAAAPGSPYQGSQQQFDDAWATQALAAVMPFVGPQRTAAVNSMSDPSQKLKYLIDYGFFEDEQKAYNAFTGSNPIQYAQAPAAPATPAATPASAGARPVYERGEETLAEHMADMRAWRAAGGGAAAGTGAGTGAQSAQKAFEQFANSAGMQFQLKTAQDAINNGYAGAGALQSGAAMKEISDRSQDIALNNYFLPYMSLLSGQQAVGAQSGAAIAGVGSNFGNTAANIFGSMGSAYQNGANSASNLALANGLSNANMWSGIGSALGNLGSSFFPTK